LRIRGKSWNILICALRKGTGVLPNESHNPNRPRIKTRQRPSKWRLKPLPSRKFDWFKLDWKSLSSHPLLPLIISIAISGLNSYMIPVLCALLIFALWLSADAWPFVDQFSIWFVNRMSYTDRRSSAFLNQTERWFSDLETNRSRVRRGVRSIAFTFVCCAVLTVMSFADKYIIARNLDRERNEAYQQVVANIPSSEGNASRYGLLSFRNDSPYDIRIKRLTCVLHSITFEGNFGINEMGFALDVSNITLRKGGDGQTVSCPNPDLLNVPGHPVTCADIGWEIDFALLDDPASVIAKQYRFVLAPGRNEWHQIAAGSPQSPCPLPPP